jgi:hypothetical protein
MEIREAIVSCAKLMASEMLRYRVKNNDSDKEAELKSRSVGRAYLRATRVFDDEEGIDQALDKIVLVVEKEWCKVHNVVKK